MISSFMYEQKKSHKDRDSIEREMNEKFRNERQVKKHLQIVKDKGRHRQFHSQLAENCEPNDG